MEANLVSLVREDELPHEARAWWAAEVLLPEVALAPRSLRRRDEAPGER